MVGNVDEHRQTGVSTTMPRISTVNCSILITVAECAVKVCLRNLCKLCKLCKLYCTQVYG